MALAGRHAGTLDGRLGELGWSTAVVAVDVEPNSAARRAVQHTAWLVTNLLVRLEGVVSEVVIAGGDACLHPRVVPLASEARSLQAALLEGALAVGGVPVRAGASPGADIVLRIGPGGPSDALRVHGEGYCGAISRGGITPVLDSPLPFGPYIAACLAVGEVFRAVRLPAVSYRPVESLSFSAWDYTMGMGELHAVGPDLGQLILDFGLAGVGAVGCGLIGVLWACPQLAGRAIIADSDRKGIEGTDLNRCIIFAQRHLGQPKASTAAAVCADSGVSWHPVNDRYAHEHLPWTPGLLVSAVDTNRSRDELQQGFWPGRLLAASTKDLRAEVLRCGPPGMGQCLRCFNLPESDLPDDLRRGQLRELPPEELEAFAAQVGHPVALVRRWAQEGGCGEVGDAALALMRAGDEPPPMFAVGFVSALAGTLLAAEVVKEYAGRSAPLDDKHQISKFQFFRPMARSNGVASQARRDPTCPACAPDGPGALVWLARARGWSPRETK